MQKALILSLAIFLVGTQPYAYGQASSSNDSPVPALTVRGSSEVAASPDQALVQLGAAARTERATDAQQQVNRIVAEISSRRELPKSRPVDQQVLRQQVHPKFGHLPVAIMH